MAGMLWEAEVRQIRSATARLYYSDNLLLRWTHYTFDGELLNERQLHMNGTETGNGINVSEGS
jgi:hypothetical protein